MKTRIRLPCVFYGFTPHRRQSCPCNVFHRQDVPKIQTLLCSRAMFPGVVGGSLHRCQFSFPIHRKLLHSFKGASEVVGAYRVSILMQKLEQSIKADDPTLDRLQMVDEFRQGVEQTLVSVKKNIAWLA